MNENEPNSVVPIQQPIQPTEELHQIVEETESVQEKKIVSRNDIVIRLKELIEMPVSEVKDEIEQLKSTFYRIRKSEIDEQKRAFIEQGGAEDDFQPENDTLEEEFKRLLADYRDKKAKISREQQEEKENNLKLKQEIIEKLKALTDESEDVGKRYGEFQQLQQQWREITNLPQANLNELWKSYQLYVEQFYDLLKINKELREYDFKKNLEIKTALCESAEKLASEADVISAFHSLQKLHEEWRETGPVSKEIREELWARFKEASGVVNKRHQSHFEALRSNEAQNEEIKTELCCKVEQADFDALTSYQLWEEKTKEILALQLQWKGLGFAPRKVNNQLFERFRKACDQFFNRKYACFREMKDELSANLEKKRELCDKVEALKESTDWKETTAELVELQKQWKTIGPVPKKYSDQVWSRFVGACDYFFERKKTQLFSSRDGERANLAAKRAIIVKLNELNEEQGQSEVVAAIKELTAEFNAIGHVPFKEKDKVYAEFREVVDAHFKRFNIKANTARVSNFKQNLNRLTQSGGKEDAVLRERRQLLKSYDMLKNDLQTYENNMGFLSFTSKGANKLQGEMEKRIQKLKDELEVISQKIGVIDETLEQQNENSDK